MKKAEFCQLLRKKLHCPLPVAEKVLQAVLDGIEDALARDGKLVLRDFGAFRVSHRPEKTGRNPRTGEAVQIPAKKAISFRPGGALKSPGNLASHAS